ncbi:hypothetical protein ACLHIJ_01265 [Trueperella sp. LYQ141]
MPVNPMPVNPMPVNPMPVNPMPVNAQPSQFQPRVSSMPVAHRIPAVAMSDFCEKPADGGELAGAIGVRITDEARRDDEPEPEGDAKLEIWPSLYARIADPLGEVLAEYAALGVSHLHLDLMDGHAVPARSWPITEVRQIRNQFAGFLEVHVMTHESARIACQLDDMGVDRIIVHPHLLAHASLPELEHARWGIAVQLTDLLDTENLAIVASYCEAADKLLFMSVVPGVAGERFCPAVYQQIERARQQGLCHGKEICVDGGIGLAQLRSLEQAGVHCVVVGRQYPRVVAMLQGLE